MRDDVLQAEARAKVEEEKKAAQNAHMLAVEAANRDMQAALEESRLLSHSCHGAATEFSIVGPADSDDTPDEELVAACELAMAAARGDAGAGIEAAPVEAGRQKGAGWQPEQSWPDLR